LAQRVDSLDRYAQRHDIFHERQSQPIANGSGGGGNQPAYGAPPPVNQFSPDVQGIDQRVATMEQSVFGQSYTNRPLADRVSRLEKKMVPYEHNLGSNDLPTRVDHLWTILSVAHTLQSSPTAANQSNMMAANQQAPPDYNYGSGTNNSQYPGNSQYPASSQYPNNTTSAPAAPQHSWLHKLGKVAAVAGRMAAGSMMGGMGGMGGYGFFP
jgi:hypothetical protein